jgi:hypothetical protein
VQGDLMIACVQTDSALQTITAPAGWTAMGAEFGDVTTNTSRCFYRIAGASEPASYTFTITGSGWTEMVIDTWSSGYDSSTPFDTASGKVEASATATPATNSITTARAGNLVLTFFSNSGANATFTPPAGETQIVAWDNDSVLNQETQSSAGATGTKTETMGGGGTISLRWASWIISMNAPVSGQDTPELRGRPDGLRGQNQMQQLLAS